MQVKASALAAVGVGHCCWIGSGAVGALQCSSPRN
jgi:hypothetical protein